MHYLGHVFISETLKSYLIFLTQNLVFSHPDLICSLQEQFQEARKSYHPHLIFTLKQLDEDWWVRKLILSRPGRHTHIVIAIISGHSCHIISSQLLRLPTKLPWPVLLEEASILQDRGRAAVCVCISPRPGSRDRKSWSAPRSHVLALGTDA
ncbi:uncharacterized protein LOC144314143 [Canis aureus]